MALSLIEVRPLWNERITEALKQLGSYQWIVFTSGNGVELFFTLLREQGVDMRKLMRVKFAVIGRKTAMRFCSMASRVTLYRSSFPGLIWRLNGFQPCNRGRRWHYSGRKTDPGF